MNQPPLNPDALGRMFATAMMEVLDAEKLQPGDRLVHVNDMQEVLNRLEKNILAAALPEVTSVEELEALPVGSVVRGGEDDLVGEKIRSSPYLPHWCTIGEEVEADKRDLLPARVLFRPDVTS